MIPDHDLILLTEQVKNALHCRQKVYVDETIEVDKTFAASASGYLKRNIDITPYTLVLIYAEVTFAAAANGDVSIDIRSVPPWDGVESPEWYTSLVLAYNTTSPYKRRGWLTVDARVLDDLSLYFTNGNSGSDTVLNYCAIRKVI